MEERWGAGADDVEDYFKREYPAKDRRDSGDRSRREDYRERERRGGDDGSRREEYRGRERRDGEEKLRRGGEERSRRDGDERARKSGGDRLRRSGEDRVRGDEDRKRGREDGYERRRREESPPPKEREVVPERDPVPEKPSGRSGGVYIPPFKLAQMMKDVDDKSSVQYQRMTWDALRKSINGLVNKVCPSCVVCFRWWILGLRVCMKDMLLLHL